VGLIAPIESPGEARGRIFRSGHPGGLAHPPRDRLPAAPATSAWTTSGSAASTGTRVAGLPLRGMRSGPFLTGAASRLRFGGQNGEGCLSTTGCVCVTANCPATRRKKRLAPRSRARPLRWLWQREPGHDAHRDRQTPGRTRAIGVTAATFGDVAASVVSGGASEHRVGARAATARMRFATCADATSPSRRPARSPCRSQTRRSPRGDRVCGVPARRPLRRTPCMSARLIRTCSPSGTRATTAAAC
jgi:hypothetical protein